MKGYTPNHSTKEEFIDYLQTTLIPGLIDDGQPETARDFQDAIYWLQYNPYQKTDLKKVLRHPIGDIWQENGLWYVQLPYGRDGFKLKSTAEKFSALFKQPPETPKQLLDYKVTGELPEDTGVYEAENHLEALVQHIAHNNGHSPKEIRKELTTKYADFVNPKTAKIVFGAYTVTCISE